MRTLIDSFGAAWLMVIIILPVGCLRLPTDPGDLQPFVAVSGHYAILEASSPAPPKPAPAGKCSECRGTGVLGDGTVSVPCPACGGDGVADESTVLHDPIVIQ